MTKGRELDDKELKDVSGAGNDDNMGGSKDPDTKPPADPPAVDPGPPFNAPTTG